MAALAGAMVVGGGGSGYGETSTAAAFADSSALSALIKSAQQEGELKYYISESDDVNKPVIKAFTDKYGIQVQYLKLSSALLTQRFASERETGVIYADILDMADPAIFNNKPEWFTTLTPDVIPDLEKYPKATDGKTGYGWLPKYALQRLNLATVQYNTNLVKDPPKAWTDLLDPKYKGKILLSSPKATPSYMGWAEQMREYYGIDYLKKLRAQEFKLVDSAEPGGQQVAAGAYMLNFPAAVTHSLALIKQGAPISRVVMNKPSSGPEQLIALVAGSAHPAAARLFLRFMLQPEIQNMICAITGTSTPLAGSGPGKAEKCLPVPPDFVRLPYDRLGDKAVTQPLLDALGMQ